MLHVSVLGSGSAGNCALIETPRTRLLIDGGLSARQILLRLRQCGVNPIEIDGILLTHEHGDHVCGLDVWCKHFSTPILLQSDDCRGAAKRVSRAAQRLALLRNRHAFSHQDIEIETFPVPHDAVDPVGFVFHHGRAVLGFLTDLGFATKLVYERVRQVHTLIIETNHDEKLLQNDLKRPWSVKQRIMSRHGHLSNSAAAGVLNELLDSRLRRAVLGHLSRDCNSPELALGTVRSTLSPGGLNELEVICVSQREVTPRLAVA
jgi:phosphoribosyl 1,2-cyclic phosphodiesterase